MLFPPQLGIKSHTKIFSCVGIWNFCAIDEDWLYDAFDSFSLVARVLVAMATFFFPPQESGLDTNCREENMKNWHVVETGPCDMKSRV
jgi:hypothetical protein